MPQVFDKFSELTLVDWETLVVYSCVNPECVPCVAKEGQYYAEEFGYIQFSPDFVNVKLGDEK